MRAIVIIVIAATLGYFGYEYFVNGNDPQAVVIGESVDESTAADRLQDTASSTVESAVNAVEEGAAALGVTPTDSAIAVDGSANTLADTNANNTAAEASAAEQEAAAAVDDMTENEGEASTAAAAEASANAAVAQDAAAAAGEQTDTDASVSPDTTAGANDAAAQLVQGNEDAVTTTVDAVTATAQTTGTVDAAAAAEGTLDAAAAATPNDAPLSELLTPEGFDAGAVIDRIEASDLSAVQKTTLKAAVNGIRANPDLLPATLTRLREAMGL